MSIKNDNGTENKKSGQRVSILFGFYVIIWGVFRRRLFGAHEFVILLMVQLFW
jgi:hypothetical protein